MWLTDPDDPEWVEPGNTVIVGTNGELLAGPARHAETVLSPRWTSPRCCPRGGCSTRSATTTGPTCFRLAVDTAPRPVVTTLRNSLADD